jgi:polyisoprenoid-binding protein YceI
MAHLTRPIASCLLVLLLAAPGAAETLTVRLDPQATRVAFTLGATLHTVAGSARMVSGEIGFDPATGAASGRIVVDARSAATGNKGRDADMHGKVLESGRFSKIVLAVERIEGKFERAGTSRLTIRGQLEIHGSPHPIEVPAEVTARDGRLAARLAFTVPYVRWGMKDPSKLLLSVAKEVRVTVEAEGTLE